MKLMVDYSGVCGLSLAGPHGHAPYGATRIIKGTLDLLTAVVLARYLRRPAHFFGGLSLLVGTIGFGHPRLRPRAQASVTPNPSSARLNFPQNSTMNQLLLQWT